MIEKFILLGASRGLGWATYQQLIQQKKEAHFLLSSRKIKSKVLQVSENTQIIEQDFSKVPLAYEYLLQLQEFKPTHLIYFAGGGPYGLFQEKKWSDHQWALNTTFFYPAELVHHILSDLEKWSSLKQIVLIGSSIAEDKPDPMAASYAAAKHALKGLVSSVALELKKNSLSPDLVLFSPGYMQTDLLPLNSKPRQNSSAEKAEEVAKKLIAAIEKND